VVHDVMPDKNKVRIAHEEIPGYMGAMTMPFDVKNPSELSGIKPGDSVSFRMVVTDDDGWIENITRLSTNNPQPVAASPETFRRVREVEPLQIGDKMPEYHFTNEMGQAVSLSDYKGQAVALTFIFTRCPFPTFCPRMSSNFRETYKHLESMPNAPTNWHLLTITFDPQYDTPAVLKKYAEKEKADPKRWNFLTGELIDITAIAEQFGLLFWRPEPKDPLGISHNLRTVVIDADGKVFKVLKENEWKPEELAQYIVEASKPQAARADVKAVAPASP
jgi:protein SCO1